MATSDKTPLASDTTVGRRYPPHDVKLLFGLAAGRCAFPSCGKLCIVDATERDRTAVIAKIAHIVAHGDSGPRADPTMPMARRDSYENWVLLCPTHHDIVDLQPRTYTIADLRMWKAKHERWVRERLAVEMPGVTFAELDIVTAALVAGGPAREPTSNFVVMNPADKMRKNALSDAVHWSLSLGLGKANEVADFVEHVAARDSTFPERLTAGFRIHYERAVAEGASGDALFELLVQFSAGGSHDFSRTAAGVAVLAYLFEKCEVFES